MPTTVSFPPPPQRPQPNQPTSPVATVNIYGKDYPIPPYTHTILTPTQCDPVFTEAHFGPYLRFKNLDLARNLWQGSILLVVPSSLPAPRVEFHPTGDFSHLQSSAPQQIYNFAHWGFFRYDVVVPVGPQEQRWTYAVTAKTTQTWEFVVAGLQQQWRFLAWSCNDFSAGVKPEEREKLGLTTLWKDVNERAGQEGGYHAQLGGGDQIYADRMWKEIPWALL
jgi:PhoD related phosphatase